MSDKENLWENLFLAVKDPLCRERISNRFMEHDFRSALNLTGDTPPREHLIPPRRIIMSYEDGKLSTRLITAALQELRDRGNPPLETLESEEWRKVAQMFAQREDPYKRQKLYDAFCGTKVL